MKKRHSITISPETSDRAHQLATEQNRSFSNIVQVALEQYIQSHTVKSVKTIDLEWVKPLNAKPTRANTNR